MSCCGRGGSWFGNCGSVGNANFDHTWHGGITVCKARQFQAELGLQRRSSQPRSDASSDDESIDTNCKEVRLAAHELESTSANVSTPTSGATPIHFPGNSSNGPPPNPLTATTSDNPAARPQSNSTIIKEIPNTKIYTSVATSTDSATSESLGVRGCDKSLHIVSHMNMILIIAWWH